MDLVQSKSGFRRALETKLTQELTAAQQGQPGAEGQVQATLNKLGRFANPVFNRALARIEAQPEKIVLDPHGKDGVWRYIVHLKGARDAVEIVCNSRRQRCARYRSEHWPVPC